MPVIWLEDNLKAPAPAGAFAHSGGSGRPALRLRLHPNRSLKPEGFVLFIGLTCAAIALPLLALLGTPTLWGILPFFAVTVTGVWYALRRNNRDRGRLHEELTLWSDRMELVRHDPGGTRRAWDANPYWVRLTLRAAGGPVENYLTLKGGGREVELGAFLSPEERADLHDNLGRALSRVG